MDDIEFLKQTVDFIEKAAGYIVLGESKLISQVGSDGLLVAWSPPGQDEVDNHHHHHQHHHPCLLQKVSSFSKWTIIIVS